VFIEANAGYLHRASLGESFPGLFSVEVSPLGLMV
jgi:hypothetical protein